MKPDLTLESLRPSPCCGIDEAGRGPWAGPVVAAAVILPSVPFGVDDSKKLSAKQRNAVFDAIISIASFGIGIASVEEIDRLNILQATFLAMRRAVAVLPIMPAFALIDGNSAALELPCQAEAIVKGDGRCASIAAASILAKVTRDRIMAELSQVYPGYGWESNMGYGAPAHSAGLQRLGVTPYHRRSFKPIHNILWEAK